MVEGVDDGSAVVVVDVTAAESAIAFAEAVFGVAADGDLVVVVVAANGLSAVETA